MTHIVGIERAMRDPNLLGRALGDSASWSTWLAVMKAAFGAPLNEDELTRFKLVAGNREPPIGKVRELWAIIGRRGGKSRISRGTCIIDLAPLAQLLPNERRSLTPRSGCSVTHQFGTRRVLPHMGVRPARRVSKITAVRHHDRARSHRLMRSLKSRPFSSWDTGILAPSIHTRPWTVPGRVVSLMGRLRSRPVRPIRRSRHARRDR
jgi:hypothetical protein